MYDPHTHRTKTLLLLQVCW